MNQHRSGRAGTPLLECLFSAAFGFCSPYMGQVFPEESAEVTAAWEALTAAIPATMPPEAQEAILSAAAAYGSESARHWYIHGARIAAQLLGELDSCQAEGGTG